MTPYRPQTGTEGYAFIERWCGTCIRDADFDPTADDVGGCPIVAATFRHDANDPDYPPEWTYNDAGDPICTAYCDRRGYREIDPAQMELL